MDLADWNKAQRQANFVNPIVQFEIRGSVPYGSVCHDGYIFRYGCFRDFVDRSVIERPMFIRHYRAIGTAEIANSGAGLSIVGHVELDNRKAGDELLVKLIESWSIRGLSIGAFAFNEGINGLGQDFKLREISLTEDASNPTARITNIRRIF